MEEEDYKIKELKSKWTLRCEEMECEKAKS